MMSAIVSPYRASTLLWVALPLSGLAAGLLIHDWIQTTPENHERLLRGLIVSAGIVTVVTFAYWLIDLFSLTRDLLFSATLFEMRNPHPLGHANYTAGLALLSLPWLTWAAMKSAPRKRWTAGILVALALLNLFVSGSRGGLLGLGALGVAALFQAKLGWKKFVLAAGLVLVAAGLLAIANPRIRALLGPPDPNAEPNISTVQRAAMFHAGILMAADRPILGWGPGSTPLAFPRFRQYLDGGAENILQLHNTPIEILATTGFAGLLVSGAFLGLAFRNRSRAPVAAIALVGYAVFSLTDYQLDVPVFVFALAVLAAQLASPNENASDRTRPLEKIPSADVKPTRSEAGFHLSEGAAWVRWSLTVAILVSLSLVAVFGRRDPTPQLNAEALTLARDPAQSLRAIALLNESLAFNPDQEIAHFNLGWLLVVPDPARAERHFQEAARLVPDKGGVYFGLGLARLNQGNPSGAAHALALECLNDPQFLASPWWTVPAIASLREAAATNFANLTALAADPRSTKGWANQQARLLSQLAPRLGIVSPGPEKNYRRERIGYPVLTRNLDLAPPVDLYDVREDPRFNATVPFPLPHKGWLPSPLLLKLLDDTATKP